MVVFHQFLQSHPFAELGMVLVLVIALSYVMKVLKQPLMIGYILTGLLVSPHFLGILHNTTGVQIFSHLGVALLLFMVGSSLNTRELKEIGTSALIIGLFQIILTIVIGTFFCLVLGYDWMTSIFISIALSFSSTIIIVKLLGDRGSLDELFAKVSLGVLILQDIVAMVFLVVLSSLPIGGEEIVRSWFVSTLFVKIVLVVVTTLGITKYILPRMLSRIAQSQEFLLIFAIGRCLLWAASMEVIGFSLEIGALIAGLTIASLPYRFEIVSKMKPLRDFFVVLFFVSLGAQIDISSISLAWLPIVVITIVVLVIKPLIVMIPMKYLGYHAQTSFLTGTTLGQVSEFSFILITLLLSMGYITDSSLVSVVTMVGMLSIAGSSYYIKSGSTLFHHLQSYFKRLDPHCPFVATVPVEQSYDIVVFGNHRTGKGIVDMLVAHQKKFVIIDYDPHVIEKLTQQGLPCKYGDASDIQLLEQLHLDQAKMIVSTIHDYETNALILHQTKKFGSHLVTILSANRISDAESLYEQGASYVLVPHIVGGHHTAMLIEQYEYDIEKYAAQKLEDYKVLVG